jgi:probable rRNA maturation factor
VTAASNPSSVELILELDIAPGFEGDVDTELLENVLRRVIAATTMTGAVTLSLVVTDDHELRELNRKYRGIDSTTDVLSFSQHEAAKSGDNDVFPIPESLARPLGDVVISGERVWSQAAEYGHTRRRELAYLAVHGLLHVLGYDHETIDGRRAMREAEEVALVSIPR